MRQGKSDLGLLSPLGLGPEGTFCKHVCGPLIQQSPEGEEAAPVAPAQPTSPSVPGTPTAAQQARGIPGAWAGTRRRGVGQRGCVPRAGRFPLQTASHQGNAHWAAGLRRCFPGFLRIPAPLRGLGTSPAPPCLWRWRGRRPQHLMRARPRAQGPEAGRDPGPQFPHTLPRPRAARRSSAS